MSRIPIRLRLTLAFTATMAVLIAVGGLVIQSQVRRALDGNINQALRARAADVTALAGQSDEGLRQSGQSPLTERGEAFAQILDSRGRIFDATPSLRRAPLLTRTQLDRALISRIRVDRTDLPGLDDDVRLLAAPVDAQGQRLVVVVGASLEDRNDTVRALDLLLLIGGPIALLIAAAAGYGVAAGALRPVGAMRRRAASISGRRRDERLPLPAARDEIRELGETLNRMLDRIDESIRRQQEFVADAGHELRTPLAILTSELELANRPDARPGDLRDAVRSAADETERLVRLAEDLLIVARSDAGQLPVRPEPVAPATLAAHVAERFRGRAAEAGRDLRVRVATDARLVADPLRLEQALGNLVDNALRHGAGTVTISVEPAAGGGTDLGVADDGPGFPAGFADRAFDRFTRADHARGRGGAGLGLSIVRGIAEAHGGTVRIEPVGPGDTGCRVVVTIPGRDGAPGGAGRPPDSDGCRR